MLGKLESRYLVSYNQMMGKWVSYNEMSPFHGG
jgi:hypothetical protein